MLLVVMIELNKDVYTLYKYIYIYIMNNNVNLSSNWLRNWLIRIELTSVTHSIVMYYYYYITTTAFGNGYIGGSDDFGLVDFNI